MIPRVIPVILLEGSSRLVKTRRFREPRYVGDVVNVARLFNEKEVDELIVLGVDARTTGIPWATLEQLAGECFMPVCYGGGVRSVDEMRRLFRLGFEKVALNTAAIDNVGLVRQAAAEFGSQAIVISVDATRSWRGRFSVCSDRGKKNRGLDPAAWARTVVDAGAGELLLTSVDRDGTYDGYDVDLVRHVSAHVSVPLIACGGARDLDDLRRVVDAGADAAAAGSIFVFHGPRRGVLVTYPDRARLDALFAR